MSSPASTAPDPGLIFQALNAFQQTYALKAAIDLDLFTHIGGGATTAAALAEKADCAERGVRILCDYLTVIGFLTKTGGNYALTPSSSLFLTKNSPAYVGSIATFLAHDYLIGHFHDFAATVRRGGSTRTEMLEPDNEMWVEFARCMGPFMRGTAGLAAKEIGPASKVLDISAGHGLYGLAVGQLNPSAHIHGQDWANVLEVAKENAAKMGMADRYHLVPGNAFEADLGSGYDLILLPNFLHHFDHPTNVTLLKRVRAALAAGGRVATVEFVPNEDRVTPPMAAAFSLQMLGGTPAGDAFTFAELEKMFSDAGFKSSTATPLIPSPETLIISMA
jgi:2-polyprenyl-3-methyl-5-hydroxy-6-metoxy-1,4-benzoquinol methylase